MNEKLNWPANPPNPPPSRSGAGKSTFANTLLGSARAYGEITGHVSVNGEAGDLGRYKDVVGYVPQDDIVHEVRVTWAGKRTCHRTTLCMR